MTAFTFADHRALLTKRAAILRATRRFFDDLGYTEIEAPVAVVCPGLELHLDAFEVHQRYSGGNRRFLHTSPEYALKRLLGEGFERIYSLTPCFRDEMPSRTHSPEFTMLEWYQVGLGMHGLIDQTEALIAYCAETVNGCKTVVFDGQTLDLTPPFERLTVKEAFLRYAKVDPFAYTTADQLRNAAIAQGVPVMTDSQVFEDVFFQIFLNAVEPKLGRSRPTFLYGWPAAQAALSRIDPEDPTVALRFELYAGGLELCDAFDELIDPKEQRSRFEQDQKDRAAMNRPVPPIDEALLDALSRMKPTSGNAIGFDRLAMLLTGCNDIAHLRAQAWA